MKLIPLCRDISGQWLINCCDVYIIDDAGAGPEQDVAVALQIKHENLLMLGGYLQGRPEIGSKGHNDFYDQI